MNAEYAENSIESSVENSDINARIVGEQASWMLIAAFAGLCGMCILLGGAAANLLRLAFPVGAFLIGVVLYFRFPRQYLYFAWWLWFLTPLVRRLIDYRSEWVDPSPVLLAPFLVAFVTICNLTKRDGELSRRQYLPFVLALTGIVYALGIGLIQNPLGSVVPMLLNWAVPILFGFHFFSNWRNYRQTSRTTQSCFLWMTLLTGAYGVYQYVTAPAWDTLWMINGNVWAGGNPEPFEIRVFSTMNSAGPFGVVMMAGLLLLFASRSPLKYLAAAVGYLSFLLCLSRTGWLGWAVGLLILFLVLPTAAKFRITAISLLLLIFVLPLATLEPFSETIGKRLDTLSSVSDDVSYLDRIEGYEILIGNAATQVFGKGLGFKGDESTNLGVHDSAVIEMLFTLGWFGTLLYSAGLILLLFNLLSEFAPRRDVFANAACAICLGVFAQILLGSVLIAVSGVIFWTFAGIALAARRFNEPEFAEL